MVPDHAPAGPSRPRSPLSALQLLLVVFTPKLTGPLLTPADGSTSAIFSDLPPRTGSECPVLWNCHPTRAHTPTIIPDRTSPLWVGRCSVLPFLCQRDSLGPARSFAFPRATFCPQQSSLPRGLPPGLSSLPAFPHSLGNCVSLDFLLGLLLTDSCQPRPFLPTT